MHLPPAPRLTDDGRRVFDGDPLGASLTYPFLEVPRADGGLPLALVAGLGAFQLPVLPRWIERSVLALPALGAFDTSDRPMGDLVVEPAVDGDDRLGLGVDAVDREVEVPVVGVAVEAVEGLVLPQTHLLQE